MHYRNISIYCRYYYRRNTFAERKVIYDGAAVQQGIRMVKDKMLLACKKGTPIEIDGRVYYIRSDLDNLKEIMEKDL